MKVRSLISPYARTCLQFLRLARSVARICFLGLALVAVLADVTMQLSRSGSGGEDPMPQASLQSRVNGASSSPQPSEDEISVVPLSDAGSTMTLEVWNDRISEWQAGGLDIASDERPSDWTVPFLLRIDAARPGDVYQIVLQYGSCQASSARSFDILTGVERLWEPPRIAPSGPARGTPDAAIPIPGGSEGRLELWGATFESSPEGPLQSASCAGRRAIMIRVLARTESVILLWGGHVRAGESASCLTMTVHVAELGSRSLTAPECAG